MRDQDRGGTRGQQAPPESCPCPVTIELREANGVTSLGQLRAIGKVPQDPMGDRHKSPRGQHWDNREQRVMLNSYLTPYKKVS